MKYLTINLAIIFFSINILITGQQNRDNFNKAESFNGTVSGKVLDSQTNTPIEYANITIYRSRNSQLANGAVTNQDGRFLIEKVIPGKYSAKVSFMGYTNFTIDSFLVTPKSLNVDLGIIKLSIKSVSTQEVVVTGQKDMITNNLDKKVVNVDANIASSGGSALDVMQNVPSVTVDADGGVALRGSKNVTFLIDGKPSGLAGVSGSDVLTQIPASSIESIEIVTNPSAKYDPEGTAGIINIVLKKKSNLGVNGIASLNAGTGDKYNSSLNLNYRGSGFNLYGNYDTRFFSMVGEGLTNRISSYNGITSTLNQLSEDNRKNGMHNAGIGLDYFLDDQNTFSFLFRYRNMSMDNHSLLDNKNYDETNTLTRDYSRSSENNRNIRGMEYDLNYKKTFEKKGHELIADINYSDHTADFDGDIYQLEAGTTLPALQRSNTDNTHKMLTLQLDYTNPMEDFGRIEAGLKSSFKDLTSDQDYYDFSYDQNNWIDNLSQKNRFGLKEQIHAAYLIYSNILGGIQYQLGIRGEKVFTNINQALNNSNYDNDYFSFYPTVHLKTEISTGQEISLSYSRRVDRPNNRQLNPLVDYSDSTNIVVGNPYLKPQYINSYEFGHSVFFGKISLSSTLFYRQTDDVINMITVLEEAGVTRTTFQNISKSMNYGLEVIGNIPFFEWWRLNANFSFFRAEFKGPDLSNNNYTWMTRINSNFFLSKELFVQLIANYNAPTIMAQGKMKEQYSVDLALRKDFMEGKLSLNFRVSDIFKTRKYDSETFGTGFNTISTRTMDSRGAFLGISYKLNNYKSDQEKERRRTDDGNMEDF
ncbi:MAG: TonB-dependent receptor [Ignavibacteriales bacterium]|nr:MAG: TonB-dependent receptor [Ignavibacteriales bacterium]